MLALYILGGILLLLLVVLLIPVGGEALYDEDGFRLWLRAGPARLVLLPREEKPGDEEKKKKKAAQKAEKKAAKKKAKEAAKKDESAEKPKKGGGLKEILELIPVGTQALGRILRKFRFKRIELAFCFGSEDPSKAAMSFGGASAGAGVLVPLLREKLNVKRIEVRSSVDFTADKTLVRAHGDLRVRPLWVVLIALRAGWRAWRIHQKYKPPAEKHRGKPEKTEAPPAEEPGKHKLTKREIRERKKQYGKASDR